MAFNSPGILSWRMGTAGLVTVGMNKMLPDWLKSHRHCLVKVSPDLNSEIRTPVLVVYLVKVIHKRREERQEVGD